MRSQEALLGLPISGSEVAANTEVTSYAIHIIRDS
jgi:hypothetical protein